MTMDWNYNRFFEEQGLLSSNRKDSEAQRRLHLEILRGLSDSHWRSPLAPLLRWKPQGLSPETVSARPHTGLQGSHSPQSCLPNQCRGQFPEVLPRGLQGWGPASGAWFHPAIWLLSTVPDSPAFPSPQQPQLPSLLEGSPGPTGFLLFWKLLRPAGKGLFPFIPTHFVVLDHLFLAWACFLCKCPILAFVWAN